jgi:N-acetylmuramoyl-L-alanine amidase
MIKARLFQVLLCLVAADTCACPVALDVGHYREKPGATSARGVDEFAFNLTLATKIKRALEQRGCEVIPVGFQGDMRDLAARTARARRASFFLSIHHDSVQARFLQPWTYKQGEQLYSDRFAGFSLFVSRANPELARSIRCASAIGAALREKDFSPSLYHADPLVGENRPFVDKQNGVHFFDNLAVLKTAVQAAVLIEAGVIVNREEERKLTQDQTQQQIADAVVFAIGSCLVSDSNALERVF